MIKAGVAHNETSKCVEVDIADSYRGQQNLHSLIKGSNSFRNYSKTGQEFRQMDLICIY